MKRLMKLIATVGVLLQSSFIVHAGPKVDIEVGGSDQDELYITFIGNKWLGPKVPEPCNPTVPDPSVTSVMVATSCGGYVLANDDSEPRYVPTYDEIPGVESGQFSFLIEEYQNGEWSEITTVPNDEDGNFTFTTNKFTEAGEYQYRFSEVPGNSQYIDYDDREYIFTVVVSEDTNGQLSMAVYDTTNDGDEFEVPLFDDIVYLGFSNFFNQKVEVPIHGTKSFTGEEFTGDMSDLWFDLYEVGSIHDPQYNLLDMQPDAEGNIDFNIVFYEPGHYEYDLVEYEDPGMPTVKFDKTVIKIVVDVYEDDKGELQATVESGNNFEFGNIVVKPGSFQFSGRKTLTGKLDPNATFEIVLEETTKGANYTETVTVNGNKNYEFTLIQKTEPGTYTYKIYEKDADNPKPGYEYDDQVYEIEVQVWKQNDELVASICGGGEGPDVDVSVPKALSVVIDYGCFGKPFVDTYNFGNAYMVDDEIEVQFTGTKTLTGKDLDGMTFDFVLLDEKDNTLQTVQNDGDAITFSPIKYEFTGEYNYTIKEIAGNDTTITYDTTEYKVTVTIGAEEVDGEYQLTATIEGLNEDGSGANFGNEYTPPATPTPEVTPTPTPETTPTPTPTPSVPTVPNTSDHMNLGLWIGVLAVAAIAIGFSARMITKK